MLAGPMTDITHILARVESGDAQAIEALLPLVYDELRKLAAAKLAHEQPGHTLQATALVHEAYLRLVGNQGNRGQETGDSKKDRASSPVPCSLSPVSFDSRGHFFAAAAEAMRRILVESARRKRRLKHGGDWDRVEVEIAELPTRMDAAELIALDEALEKLRQQDAVKAQLVTLRYFGGLTIEQAAQVLKISRVTAHRYWTFARAWLHREITGEERRPPESA
jgi:RNA polymerase sigma factor (sigma-70 family)